MSNNEIPRYAREVAEKTADAMKARGPGLYHVDVLHDDWCDLLKGTGLACNCNPVVRQPRKHVPTRPEDAN